MLEELHIRDVGVIEEASVTLSAGLSVVTGETGAGKTLVVAALQLLLGARADSDAIRAGASVALVEGRFRPPPPGSEAWVGDDDDELVVSREVGEGRSRARLSGRLAPASALAEVVGPSVEVHGQHESVRLASPAVQRELLDRFGGAELAAALHTYGDVYARWRAAAAEFAALQADDRDRAREADRLRFELAEIDGLGPQAGEDRLLAAEAERLEHAEALIAAAAAAAAALTDEGGARDGLGTAVAALRGVSDHDPELDALGARAEGLAAEAQDVAIELSGYAAGLDLDAARLEEARARLGALGGLLRKYGPDLDAVLAYAAQARSRLALLDTAEERGAALDAEVARLAAAATDAAATLTAQRVAAADRLAAAVDASLAELAMTGARTSIAVEPAELGPTGADRITFLLAPNAGEPPLPLGKAASGGERSRVALALRVALADADRTAVLVFDEVDAGIGGTTALAVGRLLATLAADRQVLCVTHLAQLAAFADTHLLVTKHSDGGRTRAEVTRLEGEARIAELSRMLSGTPGAQTAAEELLALAARRP